MQGLKAVNFPDSQYDHHQVSQVADFREHSRLEARRIVKARQHSRWSNARCHTLHCCSCASIECTGMNTKHTLYNNISYQSFDAPIVGSVRLTTHLFRSDDHVTPMNLKGRWQAYRLLQNRVYGQQHEITWSINNLGSAKRVHVLCTQSRDFTLVTFATKLLAAAAQ